MQNRELTKIRALLDELVEVNDYYTKINHSIKLLNKTYQRGEIDSETYHLRRNKLLNNRPLSEFKNEEQLYIYELLKKMQFFAERVFYEVYLNENLAFIESQKQKVSKGTPGLTGKKTIEELPELKLKEINRPKAQHVRKDNLGIKTEKAKKVEKEKKEHSILYLKSWELINFFRGLLKFKPLTLREYENIPLLKLTRREKKLLAGETTLGVELGAQKRRKEEVRTVSKTARSSKFKKLSSNVSFNLFPPIKDFFGKILKLKNSEELVADKTKVPLTIETLKGTKKSELGNTYLKKEAERIKEIVEREHVYKEYSTTTIAAVANILVRQLSLRIMDMFPNFFNKFYHKLRSADIGVLSNTYVNIMILFILLGLGFSSMVSAIVLSFIEKSLLTILFKSLIVGFASSLFIFLLFYYHPILKIEAKVKSLKRNLPFALNQMAAVSSSGIAPIMVFKLVAKNNEYGEVSQELSKIVDYVDLFGIDFLVAIKTVASITPYPFFKEFLNDMVMTVESGEHLDNYFKQKSDEALTNYKLEMQKYNSTVSTFSDIYTAVLIAAPLLLLASLSLINLVGGQIAGFKVNTILLFGTYIVIPLLNVLFIFIVKSTQPGV